MNNKGWNKDEAYRVFADRERFPHIPDDLIQHAKLCFGNRNRLTDGLLADAEKVTAAIDRMFKLASEATGLLSDELLKRTDFNYRDIDPVRHESAFAEIRAINFLHDVGFTGIEPLKSKGERKADIVASKGQYKYAIEVATSIFDADLRFTSEELKDWFMGRITDGHKIAQIKATMLELGCQRGVLIAIVDTSPAIYVQTHDDFSAASKLVWKEVGRNSQLHVCFVTGRQTLGYGRDDSIFPAWPE